MKRIGYACLNLGLADSQMRTCRKSNASPDKLRDLITNNLAAMEKMIDYNIANAIKMYRISSDIIPFGSDLATNDLDWVSEFSDRFRQLGQKIYDHDIRVSMHPGQYTVLNSPRPEVVDRAILDLEYHTTFLDALGVDKSHKIILHIGGVYGDKESAMERFVMNYKRLPDRVKNRLIIENDDRLYTISEVLALSEKTGAPVVYDNLHNECHPSDSSKTDHYWISQAKKTWSKSDGQPKIHYSQQKRSGRLGAHTPTIYLKEFLDFYYSVQDLDVDIMLEVKDKNLSTVKCQLATQSDRHIKYLEQEWQRYKYAVLAHSQKHYQAIRELLKDKGNYPVVKFYTLIEEALDTDLDQGQEANTMDHIWGYFKNQATDKEFNKYKRDKEKWLAGQYSKQGLKNFLYRLAVKYEEAYLLQSLYFFLDN